MAEKNTAGDQIRQAAYSRKLAPAQREQPVRNSGSKPLCRWCCLPIMAARRRTFCSAECVHQWRLRSDPGYLREQVLQRDQGICALCATDTLVEYAVLRRSRGKREAELVEMWGLAHPRARRSLWDADHLRPVAEGGGQCDLENLRTLCLPCHREVTADLRRRLAGKGKRVQKTFEYVNG